MARVLILKTGTTDPPVRAVHGDYDDWFLQHLEPEHFAQVTPAYLGAALPELTGWDGILLTGSPLSVRDEAGWMEELAGWTLSADAAGVSVLAVCFGHQLVGEALGGRVGLNPQGLEAGTVAVRLLPAGLQSPLFKGFPEVFSIQATHRDILIRPPSEGSRLLAGNENTEWQAFSWGRSSYAVQFHPELSADAMQALIDNRGWDHEAEPTPWGRRLLSNWLATLPQSGASIDSSMR